MVEGGTPSPNIVQGSTLDNELRKETSRKTIKELTGSWLTRVAIILFTIRTIYWKDSPQLTSRASIYTFVPQELLCTGDRKTTRVNTFTKWILVTQALF